VERLLAERGVLLTYETVRQWCRTFGQAYAHAMPARYAVVARNRATSGTSK
jgi:putative transposase